jgi:hypothetical protein
MTSEFDPDLGQPEAREILEPAYAQKVGDDSKAQRVAVIVNHGMGEQVPYQTIEGVAKAIWRGAKNHSGTIASHPLIRRVRLGLKGKDEVESELVRAEVVIASGEHNYDVHIYEAYWAPLTEGRVSLTDVMQFLFNAGWNGFWNTGAGKFRRWIFRAEQVFKLPKFKLLAILTVLMLLLLALIVVNAVLAAAASSHAIGGSNAFPGGATASLTSDLIVADLAAFLIILATVVLPSLYKNATKNALPRWLCRLCWLLVALGAGLILLAAFLMPFQLAGCHPEDTLWPAIVALSTKLCAGHEFWITALWGLELAAAYGARWFLVEYVGDVAAYIAAHTASKFYELRQQIWKTAMKVARAVYRAQEEESASAQNSRFLYNKIVVVGHSLGSVIGYDVLNGLLLEDEFSKDALKIASRTRMFLTFGSPLDKTAFLFRTQADMRSPVREVAAAAVQPMIQDYENRPVEWVNLYSKSDIISGALDYYDTPDKHDKNGNALISVPPIPPAMRKPVNNLTDPDARTPLAAHVEYWDGKLFADELVRGITT